MSKALPTTRYFLHPQYAYNPAMVNRDVKTALPSLNFHVFGSYDNAEGKALIEAAVGHKFFSLMSHLDPDIARYQMDQNLP